MFGNISDSIAIGMQIIRIITKIIDINNFTNNSNIIKHISFIIVQPLCLEFSYNKGKIILRQPFHPLLSTCPYNRGFYEISPIYTL